MRYRERSIRTGQRRPRLQRRLADLEEDLEETSDRVQLLENTVRGVVGAAAELSIGGPCRCGESLLLIRKQEMFCPECGYQQTL